MTYHNWLWDYKLKIYFVQKATCDHLGFLRFSAKRDMHILKYKFVNIHRSFFYLNAFKNELHWETSVWYKLILAYQCGRWRPFWMLCTKKSRPPFPAKRRSLFFDKYHKLPETIVKHHLPKSYGIETYYNYMNFSLLTFVHPFDLNLGHFQPLDTLGLMICCLTYI